MTESSEEVEKIQGGSTKLQLVVGTKNALQKRKIGQNGKVKKYKCRLITLGLRQVEGVHYTEEYSPTQATA